MPKLTSANLSKMKKQSKTFIFKLLGRLNAVNPSKKGSKIVQPGRQNAVSCSLTAFFICR